MKRILVAFILVRVCAVWAGETASSQPKPNPELKKQDFFVGNWTLTGETKSSPFGPGGQKFQSTERLEWMPGEFFLIVHSYSGSKWVELTVIGYDPNEKVFTHTTFNASGKTEAWKGTADDNTWVWTKKETVAGKPVIERLTINKTSPTSYSFKVEMEPEGGSWSTVAEGSGIKKKLS